MVSFLVSHTAHLILWFSSGVWKSLVMYRQWCIHTCDLPLLWVWLWSVVGRPRIGHGRLPTKIYCAITSPSPGEVLDLWAGLRLLGDGKPIVAREPMGRSLSGHAKSHPHSLGLTLGGSLHATACSVVAKRHREHGED